MQKLDDWRVSRHFKRVEAILRARNVGHLPVARQIARDYYLDCLHEYAARGIFPRNHQRPGYAPCFIDNDGRECAVAHLVKSSGKAELAYKIAAVANYAYIPQMTFPELDHWAVEIGLSREELALIQPGYWFALDGSLLSVAIAAWTTGLMIMLLNAVQIARGRKGVVLPVIGFGVAIVLLFVGLVCIDGATTAYYVAASADGWPYDLPMHDVGPLVLGVAISFGLALFTGGLSFYRIRDFLNAERNNRQRIASDTDTLQ